MSAIAQTADGEAAGRLSLPTTTSATGHFALPQALRGIAALWVVLFHMHAGGHAADFFAAAPAPLAWLVSMGEGGVAIFFALSGFVIAHSLRDVTPSAGLLGRFVLRRAIRLDPPYWVAILAVLCIGFVEYRMGRADAPDVSYARLLAHLAYAQNLVGFTNFNIVFWTLCYEVQFYLFFVASMLVSQAFGEAGRKAVAALHFAIAAAWSAGYLASPVPGLFVDLWYAFYLGILAYRSTSSRLAVIQMMVLSVPILLSQMAFGTIALLTAILLAIGLATGFVKNGLRLPPLLFLGTISYSLYLFHNPVTGAGFFIAGKLSLPHSAAFVAVLGLNLLVAWIAYRLIEAPAHAMSRRIPLT